ncbi:MAG: bifunctional amidotransferase subunit GatB/aspartate--tRNA ligase AspS [Melioribacteraceae bacterium]|nr:bifunctional amidotransferase subunit GatB/aspartate--tRNA ligase AspS [Melioribacteraceae bacterium]
MDREKLQEELEFHGLEVVIGLETHIRLNTKTKLFCACSTEENAIPNENICPICTGQMGVLPAVNKEAIRKAIYFGKAVESNINEMISWDRKHYEYPDLPKNFQLTQFRNPIIPDGVVSCYRDDGSTFTVEIEQVHIEEDAAKLVHEVDQTLIDFNKGGVPLIEVVTKPCISIIRDAATYAQYLQRIVQNLGISYANLEKGEFKSDVSVSLRKKGSKDLNPRAEIKNLNSFKFMMDALSEEVVKQLEYFVEHKSPRPEQITVLWDEHLKSTKTMRSKEFAADYRYLAEPDIPFVNIKSEINQIDVDIALLPFAIETALIKGGVLPQDAKFFTSDTNRSKIFNAINEKVNDAEFVAKMLLNNIPNDEYHKIKSPDKFSEIFILFKNEKITPALLRTAIPKLLADPEYDYNSYFDNSTITDQQIEIIIREVLAKNDAIVADIKSGNTKRIGSLVGSVMKKVRGAASGKVIQEKILSQISGGANLISKEINEESDRQKKQSGIEAAHGLNETDLENIKNVVKENYRTHRICDIDETFVRETVTLAGWVSSIRDHGELVFIDLRDTSYEIFQIRLHRTNFPDIDSLAKLKPESVILVEGKIIGRETDDFNPGIRTGKLELDTTHLEILNRAKTLPFEIKRALKTQENVRFKYKFLDHRGAEIRKALVNRHRVIKLIRDILDQKDFIEVETPILSAGTDEGAREFIVPSRKFPGKFYTLPQAPQQFKQMLMVGGFERYFQIARCFRDEDSRGDRQPEFTQLDMELSYISMKQVIELNTDLFIEIVNKIYGKKWKLFPFTILTYKESMQRYGTDRPDLRYGLEMIDITEKVKKTSFNVFKKPIEQGGIVKCINLEGKLSPKRVSKKQIEKLTSIAQENGLGGLAYIIVNENDLQSPLIKYLGEDVAEKIIEKSNAVPGDIVFFSAADEKTANKALDAVRQEMAAMLNLVKPNELHPAWVIDFPLFEKLDEGGWTFSHNPFSMPKVENLINHLNGENIGEIISQQYDLVLNGYEIGGGSIRAHKSEILEATFRNMGYSKDEMMRTIGHMHEAFQFGAPPHGGIAWGIDRLIMILEKKSSIRDVIAFPKTGSGEDLMFGSPSELPEAKIHEANIKSIIE